MPLEKGGRADKIGNRYEIRCIIYEMLKILKEVNYSIVIEALGDDEMGTDILITDFEGKKEHQQCKVRNASKEYWTIADLKARNILNNWKKQLERGADRKVALVSTVGCTHIVDLHTRAINSTDNPAEFYEYQIKAGSKEFQTSYEEFCKGMGLESSETVDVVKSIDYLQRINFKQMSEYTLQESILQEIGYYFTTDKERVYSAFVSLVVDSDIFAKEITALELRNHFIKQGIRMRLLDGDKRIIPQVELINKEYRDSLVDVINVVGTEKEKEIMTKYAFVTDAKQSRLKGDNSCIVVTDISYVQKKQIIVDFAENSDNKYLIARKYAEKYKQSLDREPHKLQIAISRCFDI